jgi:hypothetical protein
VVGHATLIASVRRRRRELALLKTLGFTQRQLATTVAWQSSASAVVGIVVGIPLGIALGRWLWILFAPEWRRVSRAADPGGVRRAGGGAVAGDLFQGQAQRGGQRGHGEEGGRRDAARLDLAQRLGGDAGRGGDLGHGAVPPRLAQQHAEPLAAHPFLGG